MRERKLDRTFPWRDGGAVTGADVDGIDFVEREHWQRIATVLIGVGVGNPDVGTHLSV